MRVLTLDRKLKGESHSSTMSCGYAFASAERLRLSVSSNIIDTPEGRRQVTLSFGVATSSKNRLKDAYSLVNAADKVLYRTKEKSRTAWSRLY